MDGSGAWWNHSGHLATGSRSLITSTENPHGWNGVFPSLCWVECQVE